MARTEDVNIPSVGNVRVVNFDNAADLAKYVKHSKYAPRDSPSAWAGGTMDYYYKASELGDVSFSDRAQKHVDHFANLAIADMALTYEYNTAYGELDYQAAMAGEPACMYGATWDETDKSPVQIYVDCWTSSTVKPRTMEGRGIAVLALAMALSVVRPVTVKAITGLRHTPSRTDVIQIIDVPTAPMDLSMASWMLGSPTFFRHGLLNATWEASKSSAVCGIPRLSNTLWQEAQMGKWIAEYDGVKDVVHLPFMFDNKNWNDNEFVIGWIKEQINRFIDPK